MIRTKEMLSTYAQPRHALLALLLALAAAVAIAQVLAPKAQPAETDDDYAKRCLEPSADPFKSDFTCVGDIARRMQNIR